MDLAGLYCVTMACVVSSYSESGVSYRGTAWPRHGDTRHINKMAPLQDTDTQVSPGMEPASRGLWTELLGRARGGLLSSTEESGGWPWRTEALVPHGGGEASSRDGHGSHSGP